VEIFSLIHPSLTLEEGWGGKEKKRKGKEKKRAMLFSIAGINFVHCRPLKIKGGKKGRKGEKRKKASAFSNVRVEEEERKGEKGGEGGDLCFALTSSYSVRALRCERTRKRGRGREKKKKKGGRGGGRPLFNFCHARA